MGYDINRFQGDVDEELLCPICSGVLEEPLQAPACEHAFCQGCIHEWLTRQPTCPVDRNPITPNQLKPVPRILRNLLSRLYIACDNASFGCTVVVKLDSLQNHLLECEHNPKKPIHCEQGCGLIIPKDELKDHNCVRELRGLVQQQQCKLQDMVQELGEHKLQLNGNKREIQLLKEYMRSLRASNPRVREIQTEMENDDVVRINQLDRYDERKFIERYRLKKVTIQQLANDFEASGLCSMSGPLRAEERICLALRYYATGAKYSLIADSQGVHHTTVSRSVQEFTEFLNQKHQDHIHFPASEQERHNTAQQFCQRYGGKPNCIGCITATHIPIKAPSHNEYDYRNRNNYCSLHVMVVADSNKIFTHVSPQWRGGANDMDMFRMCPINWNGEDGEYGSKYLLGDSAYHPNSFLYTPIKEPSTTAEKRYNKWQKTTHASVSDTIAILKQRWRCIDESGGCLDDIPLMACKITVACICLHNMAQRTGMPPAPAEEDEDCDAARPRRLRKEQPLRRRGPVGRAKSGQDSGRAEFIRQEFARRRANRRENR